MQVDKFKNNNRLNYQKPEVKFIGFVYDDIIVTSVCDLDCHAGHTCTFVVCNGHECTFDS